MIHRHVAGAVADGTGVIPDDAAEAGIPGVSLLHRAAVNAATSQGRTGFHHADQTAGLFHAGHSDLLHADIGNRTLRRTSDRAGSGAAGVGHCRRIDNEVFHDCIRVKVGKHANIAVVLLDVDGHSVSVAIKGAVEFVARRAQRFGHRDISGQLVAAVHIGDLIEARDGDRLGSFLRRGHHWKQAQAQRHCQQHCKQAFSGLFQCHRSLYLKFGKSCGYNTYHFSRYCITFSRYCAKIICIYFQLKPAFSL